MSVGTETATEKAQSPSATATRRFTEALGLGAVKPKDLKHLTLALAEIATDEVSRNPEFAQHIRARFRELVDSEPRIPRPTKSGRLSVDTPLVKTVRPGLTQVSTYGPMDPYALLERYGEAQFETALSRYPLDDLKKASGLVQERNPGTKPKSKARRDALIDYIVQYVTGS